jgi:AcrR family transcriptional regulator
MDDKHSHILDAALNCFLQYGFRKTSLDDIASTAGISRTSIYNYFKNKEELFTSMVEHMLDSAYNQAQQISVSKLSKADKIKEMFEVFKIDPVKRVFESPHGSELFAVGCSLPGAHAQMFENYQNRFLKLVSKLIGNKDVAEVMVLAIRGLKHDTPSFNIFRKRVLTLINMGLKATKITG